MPRPSGPPPRIPVREVVEGLDDVLLRRGFFRRHPELAHASADMCVANWLRDPPLEATDDMVGPDGTPMRVSWYDGVSVWSAGYVIVQVARLFSRVEWRDVPLDGAEFGYVVGGIIDQVDRFTPHTGPPLRREFFTRD